MKRNMVMLFLALAGISSLFAEAASTPEMRVLQDKGSSVIIEIVLNGYNTGTIDINGKPCTQISVPGLVNYLKKGYPELPVINRNVIIPNEGTMACRVISADYETKAVGTIVPSKGNLYRNVDPATVPYEFGKMYEEDAWWPTNTAEISKPFIMRDYRGVSVCFNPFLYNPARGELKVARSIVVEIYKNGPGGENVITKRRGALLDEFVDIYKNSFVNFNASRYDSISERPGRMLIITADAYNANMANFIKWKKKKGIFTKIVNVSTIGNNATAIKARIQAEYDSTDLAWVLLVGDGNEVATVLGTYGAASGASADPVYTYLVGGDYYQDAFISRMSSRGGTALNIDKQTSRSILYETTPQMAGTWYRTATGIASAQEGGSPSYADSTRMNFIRDSLKTPKYYYTRFDTSYDYWGSTALIKSLIEQGTGFINYIGHGSQTSWASGGTFSNSDLLALNNPWMLPFVISVACVVGDFSTDCFCEVSVTCGEVAQPDGFLVHWGSTINQSWEPPCWGQTGAVNLLSHNRKNTFGGLCFNGASYMIEHYGATATEGVEMAQTWTIFGDASVQCRSNLVDSLVVTHNPTVSPVPMNFAVNVKDNDNVTPIQNALVCCYIPTQSPEMHATGWTDASGNATISVNPQNVNDTMWVTVTRYNYKPYQRFALVFDAGIPAIPTIIKPLDFGRTPALNPTLTFTSTDPQGQNIIYRVLWDTDPTFASPESSTTASYASGVVVNFNFPSNLTNGITYWWKVKCTDVGGSGYWTSYTASRSFTVDTSLPASTCSWYQTTAAQFGFDTFNSTVIQGDSVVLIASGGTGVETLQVQTFPTASMPTGWTVVNGNGDAYQWTIGTTGDLGSYTPPSYGTYYAYYSDDDAGSGVINNNEELISPKWYVGGLTGNVVMEYGWGFQVYQTGEKLRVKFRKKTGAGAWTAWTDKKVYTASGSGTDTIPLSAELPCDSIQFDWFFSDSTASSHWGYASAADNALLRRTYTISNDYGTLTGSGVDYKELSKTYARTKWGWMVWRKAAGGDSIGLQAEFYNGSTWALVPNGVLPGNAAGFFTQAATDSIDLSALDTNTYRNLRLKSSFYRKAKAPTNPALLDWEVGNLHRLIGVAEQTAGGSGKMMLGVYPNPSHGKIAIEFQIPNVKYQMNAQSPNELKIFDAAGRLVRQWDNETMRQSDHIVWDCSDDLGRRVPAGVYFIRLAVGPVGESDGQERIEKAVLLR